MIGIGVETAIELADDQLKAGHVKPSNAPDGVSAGDELIAKLRATHALSKSTMWELRHPIDAGPIFEGRELSRVLRSHASTFTTITSIPAQVAQTGSEPPLSTVTRGLLFSIAHNAMTNAFRHSRAGRVTITLDYGDDSLQMAVSDDGIGLPDDYADRGHGFRNMSTDAERMGGRLEVSPGESGRGATVTCTVPYDTRRQREEALNLTITRQTRVLLVDDHEIMRDGLREVLQRAGDFDVVGQAGDGAAAVRIAQQLRPDVVIMDVMMPLKNGIDACREITEMLPDTRVLILTAAAKKTP